MPILFRYYLITFIAKYYHFHLPLQATSEDDERKEREKQERIEASIKKREEEVKQSLSSSLRERDKEREQHKKDEAVQHFNALLADLVRQISHVIKLFFPLFF